MSVIESVTKSIGKTAKKAVKRSGELMEITKLNVKIAGIQDKAKTIYEEIGKQEYQKYNKGVTVDGSIRKRCEEIDELEADIRVMNRKLAEMKQIHKCPECHADVKNDVFYCPNCGAKM